MRIAVAATAPFGAAILEGLAGRGYDIELLLTRPDKPQGRGRKRAAPPAKESAKRFDIPVEQPDRLTAFPGEAPRVTSLAERPSFPPPALARRGAGRACDHDRRPRDRRDHPQDDGRSG